ncbi:MAG: hypothetical protein RJB65_1070 [Actinomycetota bacterium]
MSRPIDPLLDPRRNERPAARPTVRPAAARPSAAPASGGNRPLPPPLPSSGTAPAPRVTPRPTGKRKGPARGSKVASLVVSISSTLGLAALFSHQDTTSAASADPLLDNGVTGAIDATAPPTTPVTTPGGATVVTLDPASTSPSVVATTAPPASTGAIADGSYLGAPSTNRWGTVQVQAVYAGGSLVDVQILSYPDGDRKSVAINQRSLPSMIDDAISIQAADVAHISGATYTWRSYKVSLQSAIDSARASSGLS